MKKTSIVHESKLDKTNWEHGNIVHNTMSQAKEGGYLIFLQIVEWFRNVGIEWNLT